MIPAAADRTCPHCGETKPASSFYTQRRQCCMDCEEAKQRARSRAHDTPLRVRGRSLRHNYNITHAQYDQLWAAQGGVCAACGAAVTELDPRTKTVKYLDVDHDHATGRVRGLLCNPCNIALGLLKDDPARCRALAQYIERAQASAEQELNK